MDNKYYLATVLLALGAFSPLYAVQVTPPPTHTHTPTDFQVISCQYPSKMELCREQFLMSLVFL